MKNTALSLNEVINGEKLVLVDFYAGWCEPCKLIEPILSEIAEKVGEKARIIKVDVEKNPLATSIHRVLGVPTLMLFHKGKMLWRQSGIIRSKEVFSEIDIHLSKINSSESK